jgi:acyl-CoA reductase-like NAD-dependent aldehyde dehydrogenase
MDGFALIVGGRKISTANGREIQNPATGAVVGRMPVAAIADLDGLSMLQMPRSAPGGWRRTPFAPRPAAR